MFNTLLIVAAGIALVAIVMHYNSTMTAAPKAGYYEPFLAPPPTAPDFTKPHSPGGPYGAEETVFDAPAPVPEAAAVMSSGSPRDAITPADLLPRLGNTPEEQRFAQLHSTGQGDMQGINFLDAGSQVGIATRDGKKNPNLQFRSEPVIEKMPMPFMYSTIEPDRLRQPLEIGSQSTAMPANANSGMY